MPLEKTIQTNVLKYLNSLDNCVAEKNANREGRPDINCCWRGYCVRIELKSPDHGNQPTKEQILSLREWADAGAYCFVAYSVEDVKAMINNDGVFRKSEFRGKLISCKGVENSET